MLLINNFFKKSCIFGEKVENPFLGSKSLLKEKGRLTMKMNIIFLMGNKVLNIF